MKISVITVCRNSEKTVERTIQSVLGQTYNDLEYILIDGNSTDKTLSIIEKYKNSIDIFISENDSGIYNAMNKGIICSNGDILYFLNSDDYFHDEDVVADVVNDFNHNKNLGILYGNVIIYNGPIRKIIKYDSVNRNFFYKKTICHQAIFAQKKIFDEIGKFNESYKIHADIDWLMRAYFKTTTQFKYIDRNICYFSTKGFCSNPINAEKYKLDRQEISAKYFFEARLKLIAKRLLMCFHLS